MLLLLFFFRPWLLILSCSPGWSRGSLLLPGWFRGDVLCRMGRRRCDRSVCCSFEGFACAHLCPITAISSPRSRLQAALSPSRSTWLLVGKAGWLASGTRGRLICQLRQFRSSHGSYERRALFQELYFFLFFSPCLLPFFWPPFRRFPWPGSSCCVTVVVFAGVACVGVVVNVS